MAAVAGAAMAPAASAHEFTCSKTVNGQVMFNITQFPATLHYSVTITNAHPTLPSTALAVDDTLLDILGQSFSPSAPFTLDVGQSVTGTFDVQVPDEATCLQLAARTNGSEASSINNTFTVSTDLNQASCSAVVNCPPSSPPPPNSTGATRTMGFFKTHESALTQCLAQGSIDLGFITVSSLSSALGLLWGSPAMYPGGGHRSELDRTRFILARQTLVGICNGRLFGTQPTPPDLLQQAVAALSGTMCAQMDVLEAQVDAFNSSGDVNPFPSGFNPGPATPQDAMSKGVDPTSATNLSCSQ
jgi:hypothetical protein